jgi:hypothetical protein
VNGVSVLGSVEDLKSIIDSQSVSALILSSDHIHRYRVRRAISVCQEREFLSYMDVYNWSPWT